MLGLTRDQTVDAISQAFVDGQSLRTYRHAPNTGPRKSWAAGDACSRTVNLALLVQKGEKGLPSVLTAKTWGFYDVLFKGRPFEFQQPFGSYITENTAVEAALILHERLKVLEKTAEDIKAVRITRKGAAEWEGGRAVPLSYLHPCPPPDQRITTPFARAIQPQRFSRETNGATP
ncbi:hypothetical protein K525DRAFT_263074 [Schizophyllum commune Loenen D]|nr:hypothetical protein K525DRAFT_263074 [Schizophyllum commune Loenen D]